MMEHTTAENRDKSGDRKIDKNNRIGPESTQIQHLCTDIFGQCLM